MLRPIRQQLPSYEMGLISNYEILKKRGCYGDTKTLKFRALSTLSKKKEHYTLSSIKTKIFKVINREKNLINTL